MATVLGLGGSARVPQLAAEIVAHTVGPCEVEAGLEPEGVPPLAGCSAESTTSTEAELLRSPDGSIRVALLRAEAVAGAARDAQRCVADALASADCSSAIALACTEPARMPCGAPLALLAPDKEELALEGFAAQVGALDVSHPPPGAGDPLPPFHALHLLRQRHIRCAALITSCGGGDATEPALNLARAALCALGIHSEPSIPPAWAAAGTS